MKIQNPHKIFLRVEATLESNVTITVNANETLSL